MWAKRKRREEGSALRGIARLAGAGASREELLAEAIRHLSRDALADRFGVWLEQPPATIADLRGPPSLRGRIWEPGGRATPVEWERLSLEAPLPQDLLTGGKSVKQELDDSPKRPVIGMLVELRRVIWVPVQTKGHLRGVLLAGTRERQGALPQDLLESLAGDLAAALEWQEEQRTGREQKADLSLTRKVMAALGSQSSADAILADLAESCTAGAENGAGPGAIFAVIGQRRAQSRDLQGAGEMEFAWESGDSAWARAVESEPLASLWRRAVEAGSVVGDEPRVSWSKGEVARVVALPLVVAGETAGVLVTGLPPRTASLITLERLELRASLASAALAQRKRGIEERRRAAQHRKLLDSGSEAAIFLGPGGLITDLNRGAKILLGQSPGELPAASGKSEEERPAHGRFSELFCAREQDRIAAWLQRALAGASASGAEQRDSFEAKLVNGVRARIRAVTPAIDDLVMVLLEAAPPRDAGKQQERAEAELHNVLEWVEEGVLLFDEDENIRAMNTRFAQIAGLAPGEAEHCTSLEELLTKLAERAAEPERFAGQWRKLSRGAEDGVREEVQLARPVPRVLERAARPVLGNAGRRLGRVEIYRDLSAQRVFQSRLLQTEKLAALGQMVTGIAHELSNPLTSILGYAQRLLLRNDSIGRTQESRQIYQEAERASAILRQLLFSARESRPERKRMVLNQVVHGAMELQRFALAAEKISLDLDLDPVPPFVWADSGQLQQVLMNLIGNARQAIQERGSGGTIRLRTARSDAGRVLLEVSDDGPGIPETILARIFDPFFTTKPAGIGTGLGLSIVLSVVREHGGRVSVSNRPEGGVVFSIELPVAPAETVEIGRPSALPGEKIMLAQDSTGAALPEDLSTPAAPAPAVARRDRTGTRVLVVEDEPTVARLIADVLEDEEMSVDVLLDGREALERAAREPYDLVICDMKMPGIDGQHFYKSLVRAQNPLRGRFLFVTGDVIAAHTQEFLERNRLPHLAKPFRMEELTEKVHRVLDSQGAGGSRAAAAKKTQ